jgi:hypothetical protein
MNPSLWRNVRMVFLWPVRDRENVPVRIVAMTQVFLFVVGLKTALECGSWFWGLPLASIVVYVLTDFFIGAFIFINLMNPFNRD